MILTPRLLTGILLAALALPASVAGAQNRKGEQIYRRMCASCHGADGKGTDENPDHLIGKRSLDKVTDYIVRKMPEDNPKKCVGDDAKQVAKYIYEAFYSPDAQLRNAPPRIELSRLTIRQYPNAIADLIGTFSSPGSWSKDRGLTGEFSNSGRRFDSRRRVASRLDRVVDFDFGDEIPVPKLKKDQYAARWSGGILAPENGEYEFILETPNGARLWLNSQTTPLIDQWVRSGTDTTHRASIRLIGGRVYPVRVEIFKAKAKDAKNNEKRAAITFKWKRPERVEEIVPSEFLSPGKFPEILLVKTPFPPDDRSMGYLRGTSVSKEWDEATTYAALEVADYVATNLRRLTGNKTDSKGVKAFCRRFVERAIRRPLSADQEKLFLDRAFEKTPDLELAAKKVVLRALKSPAFLYPETGTTKPDTWDLASRISFGLWDTLPDKALLQAAAQGKLKTRQDVARQVERMLPDPRTKAKIRHFFRDWLGVDRLHELTKDRNRFPKFDDAIISDLRTSLGLFLDDVTWSKESDFRKLLLADFTYMNGRLASYYGAKLDKKSEFKKVKLEPEKRAGLLTHPLLMAGFAYDTTSSPIHRGVWVVRSLLGRRLRPPPEAVTPTPPDLNPKLTTRERIALQTQPKTCMSCHGMINPLGFTLENFDAVGRFRTEEKGRRIDAQGNYETLEGKSVRFKGARQLGTFLADSPEAQSAFVERLFQYIVKQPVLAYGRDRHEVLHQAFVKNGYSIRKLLAEIITSAALDGRIIDSKGKAK